MASNGRNILNTAMGIHNSAVSTYGQLDSATKKFQNKKHSKSIIKSAKDNIFEFPVFVSSSVPMDYATATNTLLEQCYASYLQMAITAQGPVISATEARNGTQFAKFKSDTNKYLECVEMQYAHDACHNLIQEADYSIEFSLLSYEDSDARIINEHVDYQPLSEFDHFFQEEVFPEDNVDWDWLYFMESNNDYTAPIIPFPNMDQGNKGTLYEVSDGNNGLILQFIDNNGKTTYGTEDELLQYLINHGMSENTARETMPRIRSEARAQGFQLLTPHQLRDEKINDFIQQSRHMPIDNRIFENNKFPQTYSDFISRFASENNMSEDELINIARATYENDAENLRHQAALEDAQDRRNIETKMGNGFPLAKAEEQFMKDKFNYTDADIKEIRKRIGAMQKLKGIDVPHKKYQNALDIIARGGTLEEVRKQVSNFSETDFDRMKKDINNESNLLSARLSNEEQKEVLSDVRNLNQNEFMKKWKNKVSMQQYQKYKKVFNAEDTDTISKARMNQLDGAKKAILANENKTDILQRFEIDNQIYEELKRQANLEKRLESAKTSGAVYDSSLKRHEVKMNKIRSGAKNALDAGCDSKEEFDALKAIVDADIKYNESRADSSRVSAVMDRIRAGAKKSELVGKSVGGITVTDDEFDALNGIVQTDIQTANVRLSSDRFKSITDKIDRGVPISATEANDAGLDVKTIKNMEDLAKVRHDIEKHNEEILKRQAEKTKGYYRALDDIKTTADTASSIGQAVATGTRAAKEIATFKSDVSIKKSQAEEAKSKAEMTKTESELKKKQLRDYEKDKDLERRAKEQEIEKSKQNIETAKHQMKMAEKNAKMTEQQVRNSSKTEGPKFIDETKIQKLNSLKPMLMSVDLRVIDDIGGLSTPVQYIVGVKTHSRMIDAEILPEVAEYPLKKMDEISRKAKWRAGELKFLKDIVFKIDEKKQTAADKKDPRRNWYRRLYDLAHMKGDAPAAKIAEGKSLFETYFKDKIGKSKAITGVIPNASIVITQADVNNIKAQTKINLLKGSSARKFCKELFLLGFVIIDDDAESIKCMFPDLHNDFEVHSLASIKKQVSMLDTAGTKTKDMFKLLG